MYQILHLIIPSISIRSNFLKLGLLFVIVIASSNALANPINFNGYDLVGVSPGGSTPSATLLNTNNNISVVLNEGDTFVGCTLDYVRTNEANFYCDNQLYTLTASNNFSDQNINQNNVDFSGIFQVGHREQYEYFDYPENFITDFNLLPKTESGRIVGYLIQSIPDGDVANQLGLKTGDLIFNINGVYADNPTQFSDAFEAFAHADTVNMEILRGSENIYRTYMLNRELVTTCY